MDQLHAHRSTSWGRASGVRGAVPRHGLCAAHVARESARHRGKPVGQREQTLRDGLSLAIKQPTLADANESRDGHIWSDLAALLILRARKLYASESVLGIDLDNTVFALDSTTIDLCLSLFA